MAAFRGRDLHLVKKALAIAVLAIVRQPGDFQPFSDQTDMEALLEALIENDVELEHYTRSARMAVTGEPTESRLYEKATLCLPGRAYFRLCA